MRRTAWAAAAKKWPRPCHPAGWPFPRPPSTPDYTRASARRAGAGAKRQAGHPLLTRPPAPRRARGEPVNVEGASDGGLAHRARADRPAAGRPGLLSGRGAGKAALARLRALPAAVLLPAPRPLRPFTDPHGSPGRARPRTPPLILVG